MSSSDRKTFEEIAHSGGVVTFDISTSEDGRRQYQIGWRHSRPVPSALFGIYALPQGIPVGPIHMRGLGQPWNPPPHPSCLPVLIGSDSQGMFCHQCPRCRSYWRSDRARLCPYCAFEGESHDFLSDAQLRYVEEYCFTLLKAVNSDEDGSVEIDLDAVADASGKDAVKPPFYYAEEAQQNQYSCPHCGCFNDILGKVGYCTGCGTRNDLEELKKEVSRIRARINAGGPYERFVPEIVSSFDSFARQYVKQLLHIPVSKRRRALLEGKLHHNLERTDAALRDAFDINILKYLKSSETEFCARMFHRRHVYEHNGGEVDETYIAATGDNVRLKEALSETQESVNQFATLVLKISEELHRGFHELFPPINDQIDRYKRRNGET